MFGTPWSVWSVLCVVLAAVLAVAIVWLAVYRPSLTGRTLDTESERNAKLLRTAPPERQALHRLASEEQVKPADRADGVQTGRHATKRVPEWAAVDEQEALQSERNGRDPVLFWNKAIVSRCDARPNVRVDSCKAPIDAALYLAQIRAAPQDRAAVAYVIATQLGQFVDQVVPLLSRDVVLVSGCDDLGPAQALAPKQLASVLQSPRVVAWFAQNNDFVHPKLRPLPIGLDFHTLDPHRGSGTYPWGPRRFPAAQDDLARRMQDTSPKDHRDRTDACVANVRTRSNPGQRKPTMAAAREATSEAALMLPMGTPRAEFWAELASAKACASPPGNGWDCHRTWEALALGCVPLVLQHPLGDVFDSVFDGLPVAFLDLPSGYRSGAQLQRVWAEAFRPEAVAVAVDEAWERAAPDWRQRLTTDFWWNRILTTARETPAH